ncbi:Protein RKD1 [Linum grandiflorum]
MSKSLSMAKEVAGGYCSSTSSSSSSATTWNNNGSIAAVCNDQQMQLLPMNYHLVKQEEEQQQQQQQQEYCNYYYQGEEHQQDESAGGLLLLPPSSEFSYDFIEDGDQLLFQEINGYCYYGDNSTIIESSSSSYSSSDNAIMINIDGLTCSGDAAACDPVDAGFWNELGPLLPTRNSSSHCLPNWPVLVEEETKPEPADALLTITDHVSSATSANHLTKEVVAKYFHMPITKAARELNVGLTLLKKRCRELGVKRWPHRKLKSLQNLIENVKRLAEVEDEGGSDSGGRAAKLEEAIRVLENERKVLDESPDLQLGASTRRLRQACFKATYKRKRNMHLLLHSSN